MYNTSHISVKNGKNAESLIDDTPSNTGTLLSSRDAEAMNTAEAAEKPVLDKVAEALARLGRVKRVGLGVQDKIGFVNTWSRRHR